jgi:hypothetical protein
VSREKYINKACGKIQSFLTVFLKVIEYLGAQEVEIKVVIFRFHALYAFHMMWYPYNAQVRPWADSQVKPYAGQFVERKILGNLRATLI